MEETGKIRLPGLTPEELKSVARDCGLPAYAGGQIARWLYQKRVWDIAGMTDLPKAGREALSARCACDRMPVLDVQLSRDGTKKYLFDAGAGRAVEAVMIPDGERRTLCVSSQAGCRMGCRFCMTGRQGFHGQLDAGQILSQIVGVDEAEQLDNVVFMGMGEPLDNVDTLLRVLTVMTAPWGMAWSPKRITVSTIGVIPGLRRFLEESRCHLAVSLHDPFGEERASLMPAQKAWPLDEVLALIRRYDFSGQRRVSFEYTMFSGLNDDKRHADALVRLLRGLECRVNLIRFHRIPDFPYESTPEPLMERFRERVERGGITCTIRASRGEDILAACGMLAGRLKEARAAQKREESL